MPKLSAEEKFFDVSDYGRYIAVSIAERLKNTRATPVQVTLIFGVCGLFAVWSILNGYYVTAGILLILKSIIDAIDGELARLKKIPSYTGRYLDSIFDIILNFLILISIGYVTDASPWITLIAFGGLQLQGTIYNYYYVILRHHSGSGDKTSHIFENKIPVAFVTENQKTVNILYKIYTIFYSLFDKIIYRLDKNAQLAKPFPKWFMTLVSFYGLGFQLLIISVMLAAGWIDFILPFLIFYSLFILVFILIRKVYLSENEQLQP